MLSLQEIITATGGHCENMQELVFTGITTDSRIESSGELFVALCGERFDGHVYCKMALEHGAAAVLVSKPVPELPSETVIITVEDTLLAYQQIAHAYRMSNKNLKVVAVTGSNGKTSTKDMIAACLSTKFKVIKTQENFNNEIGLPKTLLSVKADTEIAVVEMGMRGLGQIRELCDIAKPDVAVVTNGGGKAMRSGLLIWIRLCVSTRRQIWGDWRSLLFMEYMVMRTALKIFFLRNGLICFCILCRKQSSWG